jgi:uncharacterized protein YqeY
MSPGGRLSNRLALPVINRAAGPPGGDNITEHLAEELRRALRSRDQAAVAATRSALAAIANAEAVLPSRAGNPRPGTGPVAGALSGLGAGEAARRILSAGEVTAIVSAEIAERRVAARQYRDGGHESAALRLEREAEVLTAVLGGAAPGKPPHR